MTMKTILFDGGRMADRYPDGISVSGTSVYECLSALRVWPGFQPDKDPLIAISLPDYPSRSAIMAETLDDIIIVQEEQGGAGGSMGNIFMIVIGVALVIASGPLATSALGTTLGLTASGIATAGVMIALSGIAGLFMPRPKAAANNAADNEKSEYLGASGNTVKAGTRVSLILGTHKAYGHYASYNVTASNLHEKLNIKPAEYSGMVYMNSINWLYQEEVK